MGGTAVSALTTVKLTVHWGIHAPFLVVAGVLAVYGVAAAMVLRDAPGRPVPSEPALSRLAATLRLQITWQAAALYAVGFGGFVAFSVYLPVYLNTCTRRVNGQKANSTQDSISWIWKPTGAAEISPVSGWA
jgi:MFS transporter, NNP family, nitrate/nitrite transporter